MGFLAFIFKFFLIIFVIGLVALGITAYKGVRLFKKMTGQAGSNRNGRRQQGNYRTTQTSEGVTIEDRRSPDEVNQKIFAPGEGEYVDFKEE